METVQFVLITGLFCFYSSLRNKPDSKLGNVIACIYSFSCLIGFLAGIYIAETREYVISWLALPLMTDIAGKYLVGTVSPFLKVKKKKIRKIPHGAF